MTRLDTSLGRQTEVIFAILVFAILDMVAVTAGIMVVGIILGKPWLETVCGTARSLFIAIVLLGGIGCCESIFDGLRLNWIAHKIRKVKELLELKESLRAQTQWVKFMESQGLERDKWIQKMSYAKSEMVQAGETERLVETEAATLQKWQTWLSDGKKQIRELARKQYHERSDRLEGPRTRDYEVCARREARLLERDHVKFVSERSRVEYCKMLHGVTVGEKVESYFTSRPASLVPGRALESLLKLTPRPDSEIRSLTFVMNTAQGAVAGVVRAIMSFNGMRGPIAEFMFMGVRLMVDQALEVWSGVGAWPCPTGPLLAHHFNPPSLYFLPEHWCRLLRIALHSSAMENYQLTLTIWALAEDGRPPIDRSITLDAHTYRVILGRSSRVESKNLIAAPDNLWFDNPVLSRNHAEFAIAIQNKDVYIMDTNSMHGTWLNGVKLSCERRALLMDGDHITFGADVTRGHDIYAPLKVHVSLSWKKIEDAMINTIEGVRPTRRIQSSNTFVAPDSDYDPDEDGIPTLQNVGGLELEQVELPRVISARSDVSLVDEPTTIPQERPLFLDHTYDSANSDICSVLKDDTPDVFRNQKLEVAAGKSDDRGDATETIVEIEEASDFISDELYGPGTESAFSTCEDSEGGITPAFSESNFTTDGSISNISPFSAFLAKAEDVAPTTPESMKCNDRQAPISNHSTLAPPIAETLDACEKLVYHTPERQDTPKPTSNTTSYLHIASYPAPLSESTRAAFRGSTKGPGLPGYLPFLLNEEPSNRYKDGPFSEPTHSPCNQRAGDPIRIEAAKLPLCPNPCSVAVQPDSQAMHSLERGFRPILDPINNPSKRKLGEMESEAPQGADSYLSSEEMPNAQPKANLPSSLHLETQLEATNDSDISSIPSSRHTRKRARISEIGHQPESGVQNLARYAITAAAGAIVGGVGVIIGLASLPPDFFN
ncbi:hypothetical protein LOZ66_006494 [Ophidiomyces ophidiicola]|nr:hypothetical protein LOZ66_006494 [Ophidiomyces ophidiicola]